MRAARLIHLLLLLQTHGSMTAAELAAKLEVSDRTVGRDVLALSEAGVPVYAERGRAGGYRLVGGYRTRLTGLGRNEAEALFLSGVPGALHAMGLHDAASAARLKVSAALLPELRDASDSAAQRFHLDAPGWWQEPETPPLLPAVAKAVWGDLRLRVRYRRGRDDASDDALAERELEPCGLVLKAGVWYLVARADGEFRVYRVDRFTAVESSGEGFERDPRLDLPAFWDRHSAEFARSILRDKVVVRLTAAGARRLAYVTDRAAAHDALAAAGPPDERGRVTVTLRVEGPEVAYEQLLMLGPEAEVLGPTDLRERFASAAEQLAAIYGVGVSCGPPRVRVTPPERMLER